MSHLTRSASEPVISRGRFVATQLAVWGLAALVLTATFPAELGLGGSLAVVLPAIVLLLVVIYGWTTHVVALVRRRPGTAWAGSAMVSPAQLAQMGATVHANGWGALVLSLNSNAVGVLSVTSGALLWEPKGNGSGVRGVSLVIPLADVRSLTFALRRIRLAQVLNLRVVTDRGLVDFAISYGSRDVRPALRRAGAGHLING